MSNVTSILFNVPDGVSDWRSRLEELLDLKFHEEQSDESTRYVATCLAIELVLFDHHGFLNDLDIRFEDFSYYLGLTVIKNGLPADVTETFRLATGRFLFELIAGPLKWNSILVENLQHVISSFPEIGKRDKDRPTTGPTGRPR